MASQASIDLAQQMYVAYYGRPADPGGLAYWADVFDATSDLTEALAAFGNASEFTDNFGSLSNSDLVTNLYQQMYGHAPDPGGLEFYLGRIDSGAATLASIAKQIADGSLSDDLETLNNRIEVANTFTTQVETTGATYATENIADAQALLAAVDETEATVTSGKSEVTTFISELPDADNSGGGGDGGSTENDSIVGTWELAAASDPSTVMVSFLNDGTFVLIDDAEQDEDNNPDGYEIGTYSYNQSTGALAISLTENTDGDAGFSDSDIDSATVSGSSLTFSSPTEGDVPFTKLEAEGGSSLVGSWKVDSSDTIISNFTSDGRYMMVKISVADEDGMPGIEYGTYTHNESTGILTSTQIVDTNGQWGISDPTDGVPYEITVSGTTFTADESGDIFTGTSVDVWMA